MSKFAIGEQVDSTGDDHEGGTVIAVGVGIESGESQQLDDRPGDVQIIVSE